jgi:YHS domain-containing protein
MSPRLSCLLFLSACAGPAAHQAVVRGSALDPNQEEAKRAQVAEVLSSPDPLGTPAEEAPEQKPKPHEHHHEGAISSPDSTSEVADAKVTDPMCKMKIDPKTAGGGSLTFEGETHYFCSSSCRRNFLTQHPGAK